MLWAGSEPPSPDGGRHRRGDSLTSPAEDVPILVVDDDPNFFIAVRRAVATIALRPFAVRTATEALRFLARAMPFGDAPRPAFIVLDFNLPDMNAPAVLAALRADPSACAIPVLVLTQIPTPADQRAALAAGARAYDGKPSRAAVLRELLLDFWRVQGRGHGAPDR